MDTAVVFTDNRIHVLNGRAKGGRLTVSHYETVPLPDGVLINGVITNEERILETFRDIKKRGYMTGSVRIAVDSTEILYKVVEIPYMKPAEIQEVIRREFDNIDSQYEEQIYDYSVLEGRAADGKNGRILCCAMGRPMLESYKTLFKNAGIPLKSCDMRLNCVLKALRLLPELQKGRFVLSFVEQEKMINYLIADGQFLFTNRMFLNLHADAEGAAAEIMGNISTINQFYKSEKGDVFLERAYLHGVEAAVLQKCQPFAEGMKLQLTALPQSTQIACKRESDPLFLFGDYLIAAGCLLGK